MTIEQFTAKYPKATMRENCLTDIACPKCGQRDEFVVQAAIHVGLKDEGTDAYSDSTKHFGDTEYDGTAHCVCPDCNFDGQLQDFTIEGLDAALNQRRQP
jgi:rubredoxin